MSDSSSQPTQPLTDERLARIKARSDAFRKAGMGHGTNAAYDSAADAPRLLAEVDRLRAENSALAERIDAAEKFARNWTEAPHEVTSQLDQYLQEDYGTTAIAHCGRAILTALGLDHNEEGQANA